MNPGLAEVRAAKEKAEVLFGDLPEFCGLGITRIDNELAVKLNVSELPNIDLPTHVDGIRVKVEVVGEIVAG